MSRKEMMMNMIMELGHEHENTIKFCQIAEGKNIPDNVVEEAYEVLLTNG